MGNEFTVSEESDVAKAKDCCSALVGCWYLEVFAGPASEEDGEAGELRNCDRELRSCLASDFGDDRHWDGLLVLLRWICVFEATIESL